MAHILTDLKIVERQECNEATRLAKELGLECQARRYEKPLAEKVFTALTADEVILWRDHCPTRYVKPPVPEGRRSLEDYGFDSVPIEVMRHWKAIKDNYAFDRYEIWTTEQTPAMTDPLLIGAIGQKLYLLARWGMESPEHLSLRAIAEEVYAWGLERAGKWAAAYPFQAMGKRIARNMPLVMEHHNAVAAAARYLGKA